MPSATRRHPARAAVLAPTLISGLWLAACQSGPIAYPESPRGQVVDEYHGARVGDPYRWLEDLDSPATHAWVAAQNELTEARLRAIPEREEVRRRVQALWTFERYGMPSREGDWYYFSYDDGRMGQPQILRAASLQDEPELVLDPNTFSPDGTVSLGGQSFSHDGRYLAYGLSDGGSDWRLWKVRDLESGKDLADRIEWSRFSTPAWNADDSGFYYGRYPETADRLTAAAGRQSLWFHALGTAQSEDQLVFEDPEHPQRSFHAEVTEDGRFLVLTVAEGTADRNRLYFRDLTQGEQAPWVRTFDEFDAGYRPLGNEGWSFWLWTDKDAPRGRIVKVDCSRPGNPLQEIVGQGQQALRSASMIGGRLVAHYLADARSRIVVYQLDGAAVGPIALPGVGSASGFQGRASRAETFFSFSSYTTPTRHYRYDVQSGALALVREPRVPFDPDAYEVHQFFYTSADGTRIPIFLSHRKGIELDGDNPTLLYGYGGFNIPMRPRFSPAIAAWLELGGVHAVACLRGGGEYGREWHEAGMKLAKQHVFDDFISAAEWLILAGYSSPSRLAIQGGSNGGLLVGACLNQRPDLFAAALPAVGVMDMLRYQEFTIGWAWASEYGRWDDGPETFRALLAYSPYHNVRGGIPYPATLITTADHDDRVVPAHSFKYAAALQHAQTGPAPILIRIETRAGHGAGKSRQQAIDEVTDRWTFLVHELDMTLPNAGGPNAGSSGAGRGR